MDAVTELKQKIKEMEKNLSLRQIALQSGINYITLRNIKFGKSSRVTDGVMQRLTKFYNTFDPEKAAAKAAPKKRGRKKGSTNKKSAGTAPAKSATKAAPKKRGRKPGVKAETKPKAEDSVVNAMNKEIADLEQRIVSLKKMRDDYNNLLG